MKFNKLEPVHIPADLDVYVWPYKCKANTAKYVQRWITNNAPKYSLMEAHRILPDLEMHLVSRPYARIDAVVIRQWEKADGKRRVIRGYSANEGHLIFSISEPNHWNEKKVKFMEPVSIQSWAPRAKKLHFIDHVMDGRTWWDLLSAIFTASELSRGVRRCVIDLTAMSKRELIQKLLENGTASSKR